jgi:delta 1-pyrroline-5-carboxylate dehydrogenase
MTGRYSRRWTARPLGICWTEGRGPARRKTARDDHDARTHCPVHQRSDPHVFRSGRHRVAQAALERARAAFGQHYPVVIDGQSHETAGSIASHNPAHPAQVVGTVGSASLEQATLAVETAARVFEKWKKVAPAERAGYLFKAAEAVRRRRDDFNALLVLEVGKSWVEADADTAEAIDFLEFYAREALRYAEPAAADAAGR